MDPVSELIGLMYDGVQTASCWQLFLDSFVSVIRARRAALVLRGNSPEKLSVVCWTGWPEDDIHVYAERYAAIDPWAAAGRDWPEGAVGGDFELLDRQVMESSAAFREFYAPRDCVHGIGGTILRTGAGESLITAVRGNRDGPFGESEKIILCALMPHLRRATILHGELSSMRSQLDTFANHLDRYQGAFVLTDAEGLVIYANVAAREIVELKDGLILEADRMSLTSERHDAMFREAVRKMASASDDALLRLDVPRPSQNAPYRLILMPVPGSGAIPLGISVPSVTILIVDSHSQTQPDLALLRELFSLTPAEARVAAKLALGRNVLEIATEASTSVQTVRTQIKRLLLKTGTYRQGALISLILRSVPFRRF